MSQNYIARQADGQFNYAAPKQDHSPNYYLNNASGILACTTLLLQLYVLSAATNCMKKLASTKIN